jgi:effector-binding domain-containing protein
MKKKIIVLSLSVLVFAACFIPVTQQKTVSIKAPFLSVFSQLSQPLNWEKWRPDISNISSNDSTKIMIRKEGATFFQLKYENHELNVRSKGYTFFIDDRWGNKSTNYNYIVMPIADKFLNKTSITVNKKTYLFNYLFGKISTNSFSDTHIDDIKKFMETDSLLYGCNIFKTRVPESYLIEIKKDVLSKNKFSEAAKMLATLQQYVKTHDVKQTQPLIAQFLPIEKGATRINIGFFIDKEVKTENDVIFTRMPKGGPLYSAKFTGKFNNRQKAYIALHQYFANHLYQSSILPFETYLDNRLPVSDTDRVNIQVNFATYF